MKMYLNSNRSSLIEKDFIPSTQKNYSENKSLFLFLLSASMYGISNFLIKYTQYKFNNTYDPYSFSLWRSLFTAIMAYFILKYNDVEIIDIRTLKQKRWFYVRTIGQYASLVFYIFSLKSLRTGTAVCILSLNPIVVLILSKFFFQEKFYCRYLYGIIICIFGVFLIVMNEKKGVNILNPEIQTRTIDVFISLFWGCINFMTVGMLTVSSKFLHKENFGWENQVFYIGVTNFMCSILFILINGRFNYNLYFIFYCFINFIGFISATLLLIVAVRGVDLNKTTPLNYFTIIVSTLLASIFLGETIYFTDIIGSMFIVCYNLYNAYFPIKD